VPLTEDERTSIGIIMPGWCDDAADRSACITGSALEGHQRARDKMMILLSCSIF
jgi:hypothetical protein